MAKGNIKITGLDKLKKDLKGLISKKNLEQLFADKICKLVPEASKEKHKFKYIYTSATSFDLDETSVSPELFTKIKKALSRP